MDANKLSLLHEQTSPLQQIVWSYDIGDPARRTFENNICTFHIGKGYFLSVAHNLRSQTGWYRSIDEDVYRQEVLSKLDGAQKNFLEQVYFHDSYTRKWHLNTNDPQHLEHIARILKQKRFDTRWVTYAAKKISRPYVAFAFRDPLFYNNNSLTEMFDTARKMQDTVSKRFTFFMEVELVQAFYSADIALYRIVNADRALTDQIPAVELDFSFSEFADRPLHCLQSAPNASAGRLLNDARIEGVLDHFGTFADDVEGNYNFEGYRYLIRGYFRFGSSGAPYLVYRHEDHKFYANAIQSEASGIQFAAKHDREGNFQYTHAIASPLYLVREELQRYLSDSVASGGLTL